MGVLFLVGLCGFLHTPILESAISPFVGEGVLETKIWVLGMVVAT